MADSILTLHVTLIVVHAAAATASFVLGVLLVAVLPGGPADRRLRAFVAMSAVAMVALVTVVVVDWMRLPLDKRIAFGVLCGLAAYLLVRVGGAVRSAARRPPRWRRAFIGHVGFVLISLFDGFCIVSAIDLRLPMPVIVVVAVLGVVAGVVALRRTIRRDEQRAPGPAV
jgi:peptidoglycan/LPS O-acetylase OafA/YrhL